MSKFDRWFFIALGIPGLVFMWGITLAFLIEVGGHLLGFADPIPGGFLK